MPSTNRVVDQEGVGVAVAARVLKINTSAARRLILWNKLNVDRTGLSVKISRSDLDRLIAVSRSVPRLP